MEEQFEYFSNIQLGAKYHDTLPEAVGMLGVTGIATSLSFDHNGLQQAMLEYMDNGSLKKVWIDADRLALG